MGSFSDNFKNDLLKLLFNNTTIAKLGDATGVEGSATPGNLYVRLCTDAVVVTNSQLGTETTYTGYVAKGIAVARTAGGWTIAGNNASNTAEITFGTQTSGTPLIRYAELWLDNVSSNISERVLWLQLDNDIPIASGSEPLFDTGSLDFNLD